MKTNRVTTLATYCILALAGAGAFVLPDSLPATQASGTPGVGPVMIDLTMASLAGRPCEKGTLGTASGQKNAWDIGKYIKATDNLLLRAKAEVQNKPPLGSATGNVGQLYLSGNSLGLGVGSVADVGNPGSTDISGGGSHGCEIIHCAFWGDALIADPKVVVASSVSIRIADFQKTNADISITLHTIDGQQHVFAPTEVEPLLTAVDAKVWDLEFSKLPGAASLPAITSFDVRSGWYNAAQKKLSGGHFWLTRVGFTPVTMTASLKTGANFK